MEQKNHIKKSELIAKLKKIKNVQTLFPVLYTIYLILCVVT